MPLIAKTKKKKKTDAAAHLKRMKARTGILITLPGHIRTPKEIESHRFFITFNTI